MSTTDYQPPNRPICLPPDERALQRLAQRSWIKHLLSSLRQPNGPHVEEPQNIVTTDAFEEQAVDIQPIELVNPTEDKKKESQDTFAWAVLYENQRGMTMFSIPYYSRRSLLPKDPAPFTPPSASLACTKQSFASLDDYQLPDGTWCWVSKVWMIDMRSDTGEVQYDGFEYNWMFRKHHWRAEVGPCSVGGWVRRRRWIRLMMRPGDGDKHGRTIPTSNSLPDLHADNVWLGQNPEDDWSRCHVLMKRLDTDGHKLEIWYAWLQPSLAKGKGKETATDHENIACATEVIIQVTSPPKREHIIPVLQRHLYDILHLFVFPDTRAKWLQLVAGTGVLSSINNEELRKEVDFWSYSEELLKII
ncbi:hypothetical protein JOM56_006065 [Amanita muscaria]